MVHTKKRVKIAALVIFICDKGLDTYLQGLDLNLRIRVLYNYDLLKLQLHSELNSTIVQAVTGTHFYR